MCKCSGFKWPMLALPCQCVVFITPPIPNDQTFQAILMSKTGVPVERQKILAKGKKLSTDADLAKLKDGQKLMLMGTASELPKEPVKPVLFEEDLTEDQKVTLSGALGGGLHNLGNTCYMNSTLQCFRRIPELNEGLKNYAAAIHTTAQSADLAHSLTVKMGKFCDSLMPCDRYFSIC